MVGSEVYSSEVKKTEVLMENFRRAIGQTFPTLKYSPLQVYSEPLAKAQVQKPARA